MLNYEWTEIKEGCVVKLFLGPESLGKPARNKICSYLDIFFAYAEAQF